MRSISSVASDLTLMTSSEPWARATSATTAAASAPSRAQCTVPPARWTASSRRSRWTSRWRSARSLISAPASRSASQSGTSATTRARLSRIVVVAWPRLRRSWLSASAARAARGKPSFTRPPWPGSRPGASTRTPARAWRRPPPMCIRHELSAAVQTSAPVSRIRRSLSVSIAVEVSAFLTAKVPPKPQHCSAAGSSTRSMPRTARSSRSGASPTFSSRSEWHVGW